MRKRNKLIIVSALTAAVTLAGCSGAPAEPFESADPGATEGVESLSGTLVVGAYATAKAALDPLIADFEAANPGVTVIASYSDNQTYQAAIRTQLSSGTGPDVFTVWPGNGNPGSMEVLAPGGYLFDLSTMDGLVELPDVLRSVTEIDGKHFVLPLTVAAIGGVYNEQAVEEAGAIIPETWNEVLEFCRVAVDAGKVAFSLGLNSLWVTQLVNYALVPTLVYSDADGFESRIADESTTFEESGWREAFEKYMAMQDAGCFTASALGTTNDIAQADVANGTALATVTLTTTISQIEALAPEGTTFGMFALPATENSKDTWMPVAAFDGFGINANANNMAAAQAFLTFISSPDAMESYAAVAGSLPSVAGESFKPDDRLSVVYDYWSSERTYPFPDQLWPNPMVADEHKQGIQKVFGGQATIEEVLSAMTAAYFIQ